MGVKVSSGLVMYRRCAGQLQFLLMHPGGPLHGHRGDGSWTIPKGEVEPGEELLAAGIREFEEETSLQPSGPYLPLGFIRQKSGKIVHAWAFEGDCDPLTLRSNTFKMEWPPKSGQIGEFPELDRADFFDGQAARQKANPAQVPFFETLERLLQ
jgi:predicted NUDIX family NTP pyrophosphohydrolase